MVFYCPTCFNNPPHHLTKISDFEELEALGILDEWIVCIYCGEVFTRD